jgi:hypothetical protein
VVAARVKVMQMKMMAQGYKESVAKMVIQNVQDRRPDCNRDLYKPFLLKYLNP